MHDDKKCVTGRRQLSYNEKNWSFMPTKHGVVPAPTKFCVMNRIFFYSVGTGHFWSEIV